MEFLLNDLHLHSSLSACCGDENMTPQTILDFAETHNYSALCLTDHLWDSAVPGPSDWYAPQNIEHVRSALPLPKPNGSMPFYFGCETELPANGKPALARENYDLFDFVVIPVNHMHMKGLVRPLDINTPERMARYVEDRLEGLLEQDLPFRKIGLAHLNGHLMFAEASAHDVIACMDESRLLRIFKGYAEAGTGIELNASCFVSEWDTRRREALLPYEIAKEAGCKFYGCSDAHSVKSLNLVPDELPKVIAALGLTAEHQYTIPV